MDLYRRCVTDYLQMAPADCAVCRDATNVDVAYAIPEPDFIQMTLLLDHWPSQTSDNCLWRETAAAAAAMRRTWHWLKVTKTRRLTELSPRHLCHFAFANNFLQPSTHPHALAHSIFNVSSEHCCRLYIVVTAPGTTSNLSLLFHTCIIFSSSRRPLKRNYVETIYRTAKCL